MTRAQSVRVGIIGTGFSASLHVEALRSVHGVDVELAAVASGSAEHAAEFARNHSIPQAYAVYDDLLADPAIDVVSVCVPNALHAEITIAAAQAGKHVICEKPLTGAFGHRGVLSDAERARDEWNRVGSSLSEIRDALEKSGVLFMYAENWVYAPAMTKAKRLLSRSDAGILDIRAEESHSGSHAARSRRRSTAGGGALLMLGSHALGAAIHLKAFDGARTGHTAARVVAVTADVTDFAGVNRGTRASYLVEDWDDVERWANVVLRFDDDTRAVITSSFAMLGGTRNQFEVYTSESVLHGNMTPNDGLMAYSPDAHAFGDEYLHEKLETRTGWIHASPDEDWIRGYPQEMQDFMECVAQGRQPVSGFDLASDVVDVI